MSVSSHQHYSLEKGNQLRQSSFEMIAESRIKHLVSHLEQADKTVYYNTLFQQIGFTPASVKNLTDLKKIPLTDRNELQSRGNDFIPAGIEIIDIAHTSGTTGEPVIVPYTRSDLHRLAYNEAIAFYGAGIRKNDSILLTVTLDKCFIAGLAYYTGATYLGASAIRSGPGQPAYQWSLIEKLNPTAILGVPSYLLSLADYGVHNGFDPEKSSINTVITIGEPIRKPDLALSTLGRNLREAWNGTVLSSYGATEVETAFGECNQGIGGHIHPELMVLEIIDPDGNEVQDGKPGEVVVTPLGVNGLPLVRFRTGDIARKHTNECPCGWKTERLGPIEGRIAQRLKYKGTTIYPEMIVQVLQEFRQIQEYYIEVSSTYDLSDIVSIHIGGDEKSIDIERLKKALQANLRVLPLITLHTPEEIIRKTGKGKRRKPITFFDLRKTAMN